MSENGNKCIKEKRLLFYKYKVLEHSYKVSFISKFMDCSTDFRVHYECEGCGATKVEKFVDKDSLILRGFPVKELEKVDSFNFYSPKSN